MLVPESRATSAAHETPPGAQPSRPDSRHGLTYIRSNARDDFINRRDTGSRTFWRLAVMAPNFPTAHARDLPVDGEHIKHQSGTG